MEIRKAQENQIEELRLLFEIGRQRQIASGNPNQWQRGYPSHAQLKADIATRMTYVCCQETEIIAAFFLMTGHDPMYDYLTEGQWLNQKDYVSIHRFVTKYGGVGIGQFCLDWIKDKSANIRMDTHRLNEPMKKLVEKNGFVYCGQIVFKDFRRDAYHYVKEE